MKYIQILEKCRKSGFRLFTSAEFREMVGLTPASAKFLLIRYTARGLLVRLKRDLYALKDQLPSTWAIANRLYKPSFVSMESGLSYYGMIPESLYTITSVTVKSTRHFELNDVAYEYHTIKRDAFRSYRAAQISGETVLVAEKEKALADYLYFVFLKKQTINKRLRLKQVKKAVLETHIRAYRNPKFLKWYKHGVTLKTPQ